jgi:hypothetical protein
VTGVQTCALPISPAFPLRFAISPPVDWLGKPWRARVLKADPENGGSPSSVFHAEVGADGRFSVPGQGPGVYRVDLLDSRGGRLSSTEHHRSQDVQEPTLLRIDFVPVRGTLRLGKDPVPHASLAFGGRMAAVSIRMRTAEDGSFSGVLPHAGEWPVEIESGERNLHLTLQASVPHRSPEAPTEAARLEFVLPAPGLP